MENKKKLTGVQKLIFPLLILLVHIMFASKNPMLDIRVLVHWGCYLALLVYLIYLGEVKEVLLKCKQGFCRLSFCVKATVMGVISLAIGMFFLFFMLEERQYIYTLWKPFTVIGIILWVPLYLLIQPLVDNILYYKWGIGETAQSGYFSWKIFLVVAVRAAIETGVFIVPMKQILPDSTLATFAYWVVLFVSAMFYATTRNEALTYVGEVLYRLALLIGIFVGMPHLLMVIS